MTLKSIRSFWQRRRLARAERFKTRLFIRGNVGRSRAAVMKPLAYKHPDVRVEREIADWLYPKE